MAEESARDEGRFTTSRLGDRLQEIAKESPDDLVWRALSFACNYHMGNGGPFAYGPYEPMFVFPQGGDQYNVFPLPLDQVGTEVLDVWAGYASDEALPPIPRARMADLLWVRKHGDRAKWIKVAVAAYTEAAAIPEVHVVERGNMLARAVAICQESRNQDEQLKADALAALAGLARETIDSPGDSFGVVARALIALIEAGYPCEEILTDAMRKYDSDPWRASDLRALAIKALPDKANQRRLKAERIWAFESAAGLASGLRRVSLLEDARSIASSIGDSREVERLNGLIQRTDIQGDMERVEVSSNIEEEDILAVIEPIIGDDTLAEALDRFAHYLTPNLSVEAMEQQMSELAEAAPLQELIGRLHFGPDGVAVSLPSGSPERHTADIGRQRAQVIIYSSGLFGQPALQGLEKRYGMGPSNLIACFRPGMPQEAVDTIVAAHEHWQARDNRSAVAVVWPAIEQIVRSVCLAHGHTPGVDHGIAYGILFHIVCVLRQICNATRAD